MTDAPYDWNELGPRRALMHDGVTFLDETLRDGIQNPSVIDPSIEDKIELVHLMDQLGIHYVNVGLPASSARNKADTELLCREIDKSRLKIKPIAAGRTVVKDIEPIAEISQRTGVPLTVYAFVGSSEIRKLVENWSLEMLVDKTRQAVGFATGEGLEVCHVTEDTTRARPMTLRALWSAALEVGASRLCLADTVGYVTRTGVRNLVLFARTVADEAAGSHVGLDWHGHNDRGLALDNALWALEYGVDRIHGTARGVGERTGNTPMELLLLNLWLSREIDLADAALLDRYAEAAARATHWGGRAPGASRSAAEWKELVQSLSRTPHVV